MKSVHKTEFGFRKKELAFTN